MNTTKLLVTQFSILACGITLATAILLFTL